MANKIQLRRGLKKDLPRLSPGELAFCIDTHEVFVGTRRKNVQVGNVSELNLETIYFDEEKNAYLGRKDDGLIMISDTNLSLECPDEMMITDDKVNMDICCELKMSADETLISGSRVDISSGNDLDIHAEDIYISTTDSMSFVAGEGYFTVSTEFIEMRSRENTEISAKNLNLISREDMSLKADKNSSITAEEEMLVNADKLNMNIHCDLTMDADNTIIKGSKVDISSSNDLLLHGEDMHVSVTDNMSFMAGEGSFNVNAEYLNARSINNMSISSGKDVSLGSGNNMSVSAGNDMALTAEENLKIKTESGSMGLDSFRDLEIHADDVMKLDAGSTLDITAKKIEAHTESGIYATTDGSFTFKAGEGSFDAHTEFVDIGGRENAVLSAGKNLNLSAGEDLTLNAGNNLSICNEEEMLVKADKLNLDICCELKMNADETKISGSRIDISSGGDLDVHAEDIHISTTDNISFLAGEGYFTVQTEYIEAGSKEKTEISAGKNLCLSSGEDVSIGANNNLSVSAVEEMSAKADKLNLDICCELTMNAEETKINGSRIDISSGGDLDIHAEDIHISTTDNISFLAGEGYFTVQTEYIEAGSKEKTEISAGKNLCLSSGEDVSIGANNNLSVSAVEEMLVSANNLSIDISNDLIMGADETKISGSNVYLSSSSNLNLEAEDIDISTTDNISITAGEGLILDASNIQMLGAVKNLSDERDKADIRPTALGLDFINSLKPVDYKWDYRNDYFETKTLSEIEKDAFGRDKLDKNGNPIFKTERVMKEKDGSKKRERYHHGLIAQDVKKLIDETGVDFGGFMDHSLDGGKDVVSIGYNELIAPMIKAMQEQSAKISKLESKIEALEKK